MGNTFENNRIFHTKKSKITIFSEKSWETLKAGECARMWNQETFRSTGSLILYSIVV